MVPSKSLSTQRLILLFVVSLGVVSGSIFLATNDFVGAPGGNASASQYTNVTSCTTITEPGQYALRRNVGGSAGLSESCITIRANNVVLDGFGHTVDGRGVTNSTGIRVEGESVTDVTIRAVTVTDWNRGIHVMNGSQVTIRNVNATTNAEAISIWNTRRSSVTRSEFHQNLLGVVVDNASTNVTVSGNRFENNYAGDVKRGRGRLRSDAESLTIPDAASPTRSFLAVRRHRVAT